MCPSCTRDTEGIAAKLLRCGIASEALRRNMPLRPSRLPAMLQSKSANLDACKLNRWACAVELADALHTRSTLQSDILRATSIGLHFLALEVLSGTTRKRPKDTLFTTNPTTLERKGIDKWTCVQGALKGTNLRGRTEPFRRFSRGRVNREAQTVNWEAGKEGAAETGVKSGVKKAHKPWIRGKKGAQTVN